MKILRKPEVRNIEKDIRIEEKECSERKIERSDCLGTVINVKK